jgi:hypothetical protein
MKKPQRMIIAASIAMTLVGMLVVGSFLGALHHPKPHRVDVGVVGDPSALGELLRSPFVQKEQGALNFKPYLTDEDARSALVHRKIDGAILLGPGTQQHLLVASAGGRFNAQILTSTFQAEAAMTQQEFSVQDIRPLPSWDLSGISPLYFVFGVVLGSLAFAVVITQAIARKMSPLTHLGMFIGFAVLMAAGATWTVDGLVGALTHNVLGLMGIAALVSIAVSTVTSLVVRTVGPLGAGLLGLLIITVGMPAAGGPIGSDFIPQWYADLGKALPVGAGVPAVRNIVYFGGDEIGLSLTVLIIWAVVGALGLALLGAARAKNRPAQPKGVAGPGPAAGPDEAGTKAQTKVGSEAETETEQIESAAGNDDPTAPAPAARNLRPAPAPGRPQVAFGGPTPVEEG